MGISRTTAGGHTGGTQEVVTGFYPGLAQQATVVITPPEGETWIIDQAWGSSNMTDAQGAVPNNIFVGRQIDASGVRLRMAQTGGGSTDVKDAIGYYGPHEEGSRTIGKGISLFMYSSSSNYGAGFIGRKV